MTCPLHIAVLANAGSWYLRDLQRAAAVRGHRLTRLDYSRLCAQLGRNGPPALLEEMDLASLDAVVVRTMPPASLEQIVFRMDVLARLEAGGTTVVNPPKTIECAVDKYLTTAKLEAEGLPVPPTVVCETAETALEMLDQLGGDVVVKPIFGAEGRGIVRVSDRELALRTFRTLERLQAVLYVQQYVPHTGSDIRVMILEGEILGGMRRVCRESFRTNISQNGRAEPHALSPSEKELALRASEAVGTRFAGVDMLYDGDGRCFVLEVNAVPGWRAFQATTGCDVAARLVEALEQDARKDRSPPNGGPGPGREERASADAPCSVPAAGTANDGSTGRSGPDDRVPGAAAESL